MITKFCPIYKYIDCLGWFDTEVVVFIHYTIVSQTSSKDSAWRMRARSHV